VGPAEDRVPPERNVRIGNVFHRLERAALRADILKEPGGGDLQKLARAVDRWQRSQLAARPNPRVLQRAEAALVVQLVALLQSYDR